MLVSDKVSCNNGKDCRYIVGYQVDEALIALFISTPKIYLVMACHNTIKTLPIKCYLLSLRKKAGLAQYEKIWNKVESQLFEKLATETVKGEGK